jgi:membrane-associated PAP2 superfamily phosphatase
MYNNFTAWQETNGDRFFIMLSAPFFLILTAIFFEYSGFDLWWVSHFYDEQTQSWPFRKHWLFETVIHQGGRDLDLVAGLAWLVVFALSFFLPIFKKQRRLMVYFLVAAGAGPLLVGVGKHLTHIYTPWELSFFSGTLPHIRLFDPVPPGLGVGHAFPAGHASGGYAFLSLYFVMGHLDNSRKIYGLMTGLSLVLIFGVGQQVRGAHFPSHDLFTLVICWYSALIFYRVFFPEQYPRIVTEILEKTFAREISPKENQNDR